MGWSHRVDQRPNLPNRDRIGEPTEERCCRTIEAMHVLFAKLHHLDAAGTQRVAHGLHEILFPAPNAVVVVEDEDAHVAGSVSRSPPRHDGKATPKSAP